MMKKMLLVTILLTITAVFAFAQGATYVDINEANREIDELTAKNNELQSQIDSLRTANTDLKSRNSDLEGLVREANILMEEFRDSNGSLHSLYQTVTDSDQKRQLNEKMVQNRKKVNELQAKKDTWIMEIRENLDEIQRNQRFMGLKENTMKQNSNRIEFLTASIELSQGEGVSLESAITEADSLSADADALLAK